MKLLTKGLHLGCVRLGNPDFDFQNPDLDFQLSAKSENGFQR